MQGWSLAPFIGNPHKYGFRSGNVENDYCYSATQFGETNGASAKTNSRRMNEAFLMAPRTLVFLTAPGAQSCRRLRASASLCKALAEIPATHVPGFAVALNFAQPVLERWRRREEARRIDQGGLTGAN
jgi:hypothetical protein